MAAFITILFIVAMPLAAWAFVSALTRVLEQSAAAIERGASAKPATAKDLTQDWANGAQNARTARLERNGQ